MKDYQSIIQEERNNRIENNRIRKVLDNELLKIDLLNKIVDFHEKFLYRPFLPQSIQIYTPTKISNPLLCSFQIVF